MLAASAAGANATARKPQISRQDAKAAKAAKKTQYENKFNDQ
jgi:hypothetical protein